MEDALKEKGVSHSVILVSEIFPQQLQIFKENFDIFVQIACPRLSIDWGTHFHKPILNPYEFFCWIKQDFPKNSNIISICE